MCHYNCNKRSAGERAVDGERSTAVDDNKKLYLVSKTAKPKENKKDDSEFNGFPLNRYFVHYSLHTHVYRNQSGVTNNKYLKIYVIEIFW